MCDDSLWRRHFIKSLLDTIQGIKTKKGHKEDLTLNCNKMKITINTYVNENCSFLTATNSSGDEVFTISDLNCVYKLFFVLRDIFPIGAILGGESRKGEFSEGDFSEGEFS